jgi:hypothetical protein
MTSTQGQKGRRRKAAEVTINPWLWPYYDAKLRENVNPIATRSVLVNYEALAFGGADGRTNELVLRALVEVSFFKVLNLHARTSHQNSKFELMGMYLQIQGGKKQRSPSKELYDYLVDLIIIDLGENEPIIGMDMEMPDHPSNPIPAFNEFYSTNFEDLLLFFNALLANNGVFAILKPLWNKHYNDTLLKRCWLKGGCLSR